MKKAFLLIVILVSAAIALLIWNKVSNSRRAAAPANTIVRIYFAGGANISSDANSAAFTNIFCCPQARNLQAQTLGKLSRAPGAWFKNKLPAGLGDGSTQLHPLLDDLLESEWVFEMHDAPSSPEYALAIQLNDARAQLWQTNLRALLESWTGIKATDVTGGWELKKDMPPNLFRIVRAGKWLVIGCGQDELPLSDAWVGGSQLPDANETNWVSAKLNWPRLAEIYPEFGNLDLPAMQLQIIGTGGELLSSGKFELSQPLPALDEWQIPVDLMHGPLTSFTAVRGFAPWLEKQPWAKWLEIPSVPDQLFIWSVGQNAVAKNGQFPNETYIAVPVSNSITALAILGHNLNADTNWEKDLMYPLPLVQTNNRIALANVPFFVAPEVQAMSDPSGDYLFADVFPNLPGPQPPDALFQQLSRENRLFYHWEFTPARLNDLPHLSQLALMMTQHQELDQASAAARWLNHIEPMLGDSVTEVTQTGPSELSFTRSASGGLTAIEFIALAEWLEAPNFPGCNLSATYTPETNPHKKIHRLQSRPRPVTAATTQPPIKH